MREELSTARHWLQSKGAVSLAIVAETWGSAPRPVGSLLVVAPDGRFSGSVSGGCVEGAVVAEATTVSAPPGAVRRLTYGVENDNAFAAGLACGGQITILLIALTSNDDDVLSAALAAIDSRKAACLTANSHGLALTDGSKNSGSVVSYTDDTVKIAIEPAPQLVVIGAVHIAEFLVPMAHRCGFDCAVIDPRAAFVEARKLAPAAIICDWPDDALPQRTIDSRTALVALTHDPKIDDAALTEALKSPAFYIGALGSKKSHAKRLDRLRTHGFDASALARISGPVGLDIGARSPAEIAVSILAEMIQTLRQAKGG